MLKGSSKGTLLVLFVCPSVFTTVDTELASRIHSTRLSFSLKTIRITNFASTGCAKTVHSMLLEFHPKIKPSDNMTTQITSLDAYSNDIQRCMWPVDDSNGTDVPRNK
jgi:hypothetical protein